MSDVKPIDGIKRDYESWRKPPIPEPRNWRQKRGFAFEKLIKAVLDVADLDARASYKPAGEQIDGSFVYLGRVYLLEAKWVSDPVEASVLYAFKGKVDGKLAGTIGVFISMSGYAQDAIDALVAGKSLNLVLFDKDDWEASLSDTGASYETFGRSSDLQPI